MADETPARKGARGIVLSLVSALGFSTLGLFTKLLYAEGMTIAQALSWRFTIAAAALWLWLLLTGRARQPRGHFRQAFLLGVIGFAPQAGLYFLTVSMLDPGITSLLLYLYPAFVIVFSAIFLKARPKPLQLAVLAISLLGCVLTFWQSGTYPLEGLALGVCVAVAYGLYLVAAQKILAGIDSAYSTACLMLGAAAVYWAVSFATGSAGLPPGGLAWVGILGIAIFASIVPIVTLFAAIKDVGASTASLVSTVEPVLTVAFSVALLDERFTPLQGIGGGLIVAAVLLLAIVERLKPKAVAD